MDPILAIGTVSSVLGICELVKIATLSDLSPPGQVPYRSADLKVNFVIGQLSTLNTALNQVTYISKNNSDLPQDAQLVRVFTTS